MCELWFIKNLLKGLKTSERKEQEKTRSHSTEIFKRSIEALFHSHFLFMWTRWLNIHTQALKQLSGLFQEYKTNSNSWVIEGFYTQCCVYDQIQVKVMVNAALGVELHLCYCLKSQNRATKSHFEHPIVSYKWDFYRVKC